ncbi:MAG: endonuclease domain-containing protein [Microbacteriaceae bacterium]|nr:endonuclease domain-containing protein [Microbacteriaceae bacterium]MCL2793724.1 endonuclease domain-containing protein [Microbacteriaceae bacterium]
MTSPLCALGHVARTSELAETGIDGKGRAALVASGAVYKPRQGTFACTHLEPAERVAIACKARLDCVAVLRAEGVWTGHYAGIHLRLRRGDRHAPARVAATHRDIRVHWDTELFPGGSKTRVSTKEALFCAARCLPPEDLIAAIESAVHLGRLTPAEAHEVMVALPRRLRVDIEKVDTLFRAQSGYETKVRLRLEARGHNVVPQFPLHGVGHLDNLVDRVVAVETDGKQHAETLEEDHRRDLMTEAAGIRVLRIGPRLVDREWDKVLTVIERMIREAQQRKVTDSAKPLSTRRIRRTHRPDR